MNTFTHERLDVYRAAIEFLVLADSIASSLPKGRAYLADQLRRASLSIPLNIAEGAGEFAPADKARFYRMARRSGTECAAILHACSALHLAPDNVTNTARGVLDRIVAMLTAMVRKNLQESGADALAASDAEA
jgi:four helix bundle protein